MKYILTIIAITVFSLTSSGQDEPAKTNIRPVPSSVKNQRALDFLAMTFYLYDIDVQVPPVRDLAFFQAQLDNPDNKFKVERTAEELKAQYDAHRTRVQAMAAAKTNIVGVTDVPSPLNLDKLDFDLPEEQVRMYLILTVQVLGEQLQALRARVEALEAAP